MKPPKGYVDPGIDWDSIPEQEHEQTFTDKLLAADIDGIFRDNLQPAFDSAVEFGKNIRHEVGKWVDDTINDVGEFVENPGTDTTWKAYEDMVAPAGKLAVTPFIPGQVRGVAGALYAPKFISDTLNSGSKNIEEDGVGQGILNTAKELVVDPLTNLASKSMSGEIISDIYNHPGNLWDEVLAPVMLTKDAAHGAYKGSKYVAGKANYELPDIGLSLDKTIEKSFDDLDNSSFKNYNAEPTTPAYSVVDEGLAAGEQAWIGQTMPHGENGCVEGVVRMGSYYSDFLRDNIDETYVPTLVEKAGDRCIPFDAEKLEKGDVIVYGDNDHVVLYDGNGGYIGNSSSRMKIVHGNDYNEIGLTPTKIIKTGGKSSGYTPTKSTISDDTFSTDSVMRDSSSDGVEIIGKATDEKPWYEEAETTEAAEAEPPASKPIVVKRPEGSKRRSYDEDGFMEDFEDDILEESPEPNTPAVPPRSPVEPPKLSGIGKDTNEPLKVNTEPLSATSESPTSLFQLWNLTKKGFSDSHGSSESPNLFELAKSVTRSDSSERPVETSKGNDIGKDTGEGVKIDPGPSGSEIEALLESDRGLAEAKSQLDAIQNMEDIESFHREEAKTVDAMADDSAGSVDAGIAFRNDKGYPDRYELDLEEQLLQQLQEKYPEEAGETSRPVEQDPIVLDEDPMRADVDEMLADMNEEAPLMEELEDDIYSRRPSAPVNPNPIPAPTPKKPAPLPEYTPAEEITGPVTKQHITDRITQLFDPVFSGGMDSLGRDMDVEGKYGVTRGSIRTATTGDLSTIGHELGHAIMTRLGLTPFKFTKSEGSELQSAVHRRYGTDTYTKPSEIIREGLSEYMRDYLDGKDVASLYPEVHKRLAPYLDTSTDIGGRITEIKDLYDRYQSQSSGERVQGGIAKEEAKTIGERLRDFFSVSELLDDKNPLKAVDELREKLLGRGLSTGESVYKNARISMNIAKERAGMLLCSKQGDGAIPALEKAYGVKLHNVSFRSVLDNLLDNVHSPGREWMKSNGFKTESEGLDSLLAAQNLLDMQKFDIESLRILRDGINGYLAKALADERHAYENAKHKTATLDEFFLDFREDEYTAWMGQIQEVLGMNEAKAFKRAYDTAKELGTGKELVDVFDRFRSELDILEKEYQHAYQGPFSIADAETLLKSAPREFINAARDMHDVIDNVFTIGKAAGLISDETAAFLADHCSSYIPRDLAFAKKGDVTSAGGVNDFGDNGYRLKDRTGETPADKGQQIVSPLVSIQKEAYSVLDAAEKNKVAQIFVNGVNKLPGGARIAERVAPESISGETNGNYSRFVVYEKGKPVTYETATEFYNALKSCGTTPTAVGTMTKLIYMGAKLTRTLCTSMPDFVVKNAMRDVLSASVNSRNSRGATPSALVKNFTESLQAYGEAFKHRWNRDSVYQDFKASGAEQSNIINADRDSLQRQIDELTGNQGNLRKYWDSLVGQVQDFGNFFETLPRLAEWQRSMKAGADPVQSALNARDVTLDFTRAGNSTRNANQYSAFFNAAVQGTYRMYETFREDPATFMARTAMVAVVPQLIEYALYGNESWYKDRPDDEKNSSWLFKMGDTIVKLPKPPEMSLFAGATENLCETLLGDKKLNESICDMAALAGKTLIPSITSNAWLTPLKMSLNSDDFTGQQIVPDRLKNKPLAERTNNSTSQLAKDISAGTDVIAKTAGKALGKRDWEGVSPLMVQYAGRNTLYSPWRYAAGISDGEPTKGLTSGFIGNPKSSQVRSDYWDMKDLVEREYAEHGGKEKASGKYKRNYEIMHAAEQALKTARAEGQKKRIMRDALKSIK